MSTDTCSGARLLSCSYMGQLLALQPNECLTVGYSVLEPTFRGLEDVLVMILGSGKYRARCWEVGYITPSPSLPSVCTMQPLAAVLGGAAAFGPLLASLHWLLGQVGADFQVLLLTCE